jgi:putative inorganic carbon (HCO3(-)) transporter
MRQFSARQLPRSFKTILIFVAILGLIAAGITYLAQASPSMVIMIAAVLVGCILVVIWMRTPVLALYTTLIVISLPAGLIPDSIQSNLNRSLTVVAFLVWAIQVITQRRRINWTRTSLLMLAFLLWSVLTMLWAQDLGVARDKLGGYALRFILFFLLISNEIKSQKSLNSLMYALAIAGWIYIAVGIFTLLTQGYQVGSRFKILEENENAIGTLFPVVLVGVIWLAKRRSNPRKALWLFLSILFLCLSLVLVGLSGSRGSAITWVITVLALLLWRDTRPWGIVGLILLAMAAISAPFILSTTIERFIGNTGDTMLGGREAIWQAASLLILDHPLTGVGIGNSPTAMMSIILMFRSVYGASSVSIHNPVLTIWAETGLPGLFLYLGVLASSLWIFYRQFIHYRNAGMRWMMPYFGLVASAFIGYFASWIKGGGMELGHSYFLMLALLVIPSHLKLNTNNQQERFSTTYPITASTTDR